MIRIGLDVGDNGYELRVRGHAGFAKNGADIVCAGVSAIVYTLMGYLKNIDDIEYLTEADKSGEVLVSCKGGYEVTCAFDMAIIGLQQIAIKYPNNVRVDIYPQ